MHGIGQLLLRSIEPELYRTIDAVVATGEPRRQAEQAVLGLDHATLGGALAREWGLPASIGDAIEHYGAPLEHLPDDRLAAILSLAETLASALVAGSCAVESLQRTATRLERGDRPRPRRAGVADGIPVRGIDRLVRLAGNLNGPDHDRPALPPL